MTTTKRCEVCGLPPCNLWMTGCEGHCHCNGHPRPDDSEKVCERCQDHHHVCSVCHKAPCEDPVFHPKLERFAWVPCPSCSTPKEVPPRTEEKIDEFNETWPQLFAWSEQREEYVDQTGAVKAFLLSYGKERELEMWRKCREAADKLMDDEAVFNKNFDCSVVPAHLVLSLLDALNPDHSSPDEGREE